MIAVRLAAGCALALTGCSDSINPGAPGEAAAPVVVISDAWEPPTLTEAAILADRLLRREDDSTNPVVLRTGHSEFDALNARLGLSVVVEMFPISGTVIFYCNEYLNVAAAARAYATMEGIEYAVGLDTLRPEIIAHYKPGFFGFGNNPRERQLQRIGLHELRIRRLLRLDERGVQTGSRPRVGLVHVAAEYDGVHDREDAGFIFF